MIDIFAIAPNPSDMVAGPQKLCTCINQSQPCHIKGWGPVPNNVCACSWWDNWWSPGELSQRHSIRASVLWFVMRYGRTCWNTPATWDQAVCRYLQPLFPLCVYFWRQQGTNGIFHFCGFLWQMGCARLWAPAALVHVSPTCHPYSVCFWQFGMEKPAHKEIL